MSVRTDEEVMDYWRAQPLPQEAQWTSDEDDLNNYPRRGCD